MKGKFQKIEFASLIFIALILLLSGTNKAFSVTTLEATSVTCPEKLKLGEKGEINYNIRNNGPYKIHINTNKLTLDDPTQTNYSITNFGPKKGSNYSGMVNPFSSEIFEGNFRSQQVGFHYVNLSISYTTSLDKFTKMESEKEELCKIEVAPIDSNESPISTYLYQITLSILLFPVIAGLVEYFIKRSFVKRDVEAQQRIEHSTWLLQHIHSMVSEYYLPLANFGALAKRYIEKASTSKDESDIKSAYYNTALFLAKVVEFERAIGGNFLFIKSSNETTAKATSLEIDASLPFDRKDIDEIAKNVNTKKDKILSEPTFNLTQFSYFTSWLKSDNCISSREQVQKKLKILFRLLDEEGERALQPEYFLKYKQSQETSEQSIDKKPLFSINQLSPKYCSPGEKVYVFGEGFNKINHKFYIGKESRELAEYKINRDDYAQLEIPNDINDGSYDVFAEYSDMFGNKTKTIAIVIHVR